MTAYERRVRGEETREEWRDGQKEWLRNRQDETRMFRLLKSYGFEDLRNYRQEVSPQREKLFHALSLLGGPHTPADQCAPRNCYDGDIFFRMNGDTVGILDYSTITPDGRGLITFIWNNIVSAKETEIRGKIDKLANLLKEKYGEPGENR